MIKSWFSTFCQPVTLPKNTFIPKKKNVLLYTVLRCRKTHIYGEKKIKQTYWQHLRTIILFGKTFLNREHKLQYFFTQGFRAEFRSILCLNKVEGRVVGRRESEGREADEGGRGTEMRDIQEGGVTLTYSVVRSSVRSSPHPSYRGRGHILETAL